MKHPNPLMLLRIAQGDAFGAATEYIKFPRDQHIYDAALRFERYGRHPTHGLAAGQYTDDTQMSIAVAEVLIEHFDVFKHLDMSVETAVGLGVRLAPGVGQVDATALVRGVLRTRFADAFVRCFKRDERKGYARGFQAFLESITDGTEFLLKIHADSDKNGAAMRSVPLGVLENPQLVMRLADVQARVTHDTPGGVASSILVALMSHFALYCVEPLSAMPDWLMRFGIADVRPWSGAPVTGPGVGMATARAVLTLVTEKTTLLDIARTAIEWGGDTDSVLAIAWGIASARMREDLPPFFEGGLENGSYGRTFLRNLGAKLMERS